MPRFRSGKEERKLFASHGGHAEEASALRQPDDLGSGSGHETVDAGPCRGCVEAMALRQSPRPSLLGLTLRGGQSTVHRGMRERASQFCHSSLEQPGRGERRLLSLLRGYRSRRRQRSGCVLPLCFEDAGAVKTHARPDGVPLRLRSAGAVLGDGSNLTCMRSISIAVAGGGFLAQTTVSLSPSRTR